MTQIKDLVRQKFGRLTVLYRGEDYYTSGGNKKIMWMCKCDCGNEKLVSGNHLRSGGIKSCGCLNHDVASAKMKKYNHKENKYEFFENHCIGYDSNNNSFIIDKEDYNNVSQYFWYKHHSGYFTTKINLKSVTLHRLVLNFPDMSIDHINNLKNDCRKCNLRYANHSLNNMNKRKQHNNTSGTTGVKWHKRDKVWEVFIKNIYLGRFNTLKEAIIIRKNMKNYILVNLVLTIHN